MVEVGECLSTGPLELKESVMPLMLDAILINRAQHILSIMWKIYQR